MGDANDWLSSDESAADPEVVLSVRIDDDSVAAVERQRGRLRGVVRCGSSSSSVRLQRPVDQVDDDPCVLAGLLPDGAVGARVQDLFDVWHEALAGGGAWLCVLPHESRFARAPVVFRDADGVETDAEVPMPCGAGNLGPVDEAAHEPVDARAVLAGAVVKALWPIGAPRPAELVGWGGSKRDEITSLVLEHGSLCVAVERGRNAGRRGPRELRDRLELVLHALGPRGAARGALAAAEIEVPGTVAGRTVAFAGCAGEGAWVLMWKRRRRDVLVTGSGDPPARLDLEVIGPEGV
jgi:hypothetical protein